MRFFILFFLLFGHILFAQYQDVVATPEVVLSDITIIDIRTPEEWAETGIVKGSKTIMFFDEQGNYNIEDFLAKLDQVVDKQQPFAIICRTGSRTSMVGRFLSDEYGYKVINLKGGIMKLLYDGYRLSPIDSKE